jgi:di/tricarboxylate transporter
MAWEVADIAATVAALRSRGVVFEEVDLPGLKTVDGIATIYIVMNISILGVIPWREFMETANSDARRYVISVFIERIYGSTAGVIATLLIMWTAFATTCLTSAMFLTGLAPNLLALSLVKTTAKIDISWTEWFMGIMPVGVLLFIFLPLMVYKIYPPELKSSPDVPIWAGEELKKWAGLASERFPWRCWRCSHSASGSSAAS